MTARRLTVLLFLILAYSHTASAAPYYPGGYLGTPAQTETDAPVVIVQSGINKLTRFISSGSAQNRATAMIFLETEVAPYFDFEYMTRWAAGPAWRTMPPGQRADMQRQLTSAFMNTLVQKLANYTNQPVRYFTPRGQSSNDVRVKAWIMQPNGIPTKLEFRFYKSKNGWKIFDVKAAGNSAVVHYRNQFRHLYRNRHPG